MSADELFEVNRRKWWLFQMNPATKLSKIVCKQVSPCFNENGTANLKLETEGQTYFYHSQEDPVEEARLKFEQLDLKGYQVLFIFGIGLGYIYDWVKAWLKEDEGRYLVFLEDNLEVIYHLFHTERGKQIVHNKQVRVAFLEHSGGFLNELITAFALKKYTIVGLDLYTTLRPEIYKQLKAKIDFLFNLKSFATIEYSNHGSSFFSNYFQNLLRLPEAALGTKLFGQFAAIPAIICGAGPSLAKNLATLTQLRDRALIFAGGTAMNALNAAGFLPHFGIGIDPNPAQYTRLIMNQGFETPFFYRNRILHEALDLVHGQHLYITGTAGYKASDWFEERCGIKQQKNIEEGCNVVNFSLAVAHAMGCNPIILVGLDLAYTDRKSYAPGILNHPIHNRRDYFGTKSVDEDVIVKPDIFEKPTFTLWKWIAESMWFANFAKIYGNKTFMNATEGGIGFAGIPNFSLEEVANNFLTHQFDLNGMVHQRIEQAQNPTTLQGIEESMHLFSQSLDRAEFSCRIVQKDCEETVRKYRYDIEVPPLSEESLRALEELEEEPAYIYLLKAFSNHFFDLHKLDYESIFYDYPIFGAKAIEIQKAHLNSLRYAFLRETAKVVKNIVEAILKREADRQLKILLRPAPAVPAAPSLSSSIYTFIEGKIHIEDSELDLHISEDFQPDPKAVVQERYPNGQLAIEQFYLKGLLHGPSSFFSEEGSLLSKSWFLQGKMHGKALYYYKSGSISSIEQYKEGLREGKQESFYRDGRPKAALSYLHGKLEGPVVLYYPSGQIKRELQFVEGKRHGIEKIWNEEGLLIIEAAFDRDLPTGTAHQWYENGNMALEIIYEQDSRNFMIREWDKNGFPKVTERKITGDYFDQVAQQTNRLTNTLDEVIHQVDSLETLIETVSNNKNQPYSHLLDVKKLTKEMENLHRISKKLIQESGFNSSENEMFWKGPSAKREVENQVQLMATEIAKEMNKIQSSLIGTLGTLTKKLKIESEKTSEEKPKSDATNGE